MQGNIFEEQKNPRFDQGIQWQTRRATIDEPTTRG